MPIAVPIGEAAAVGAAIAWALSSMLWLRIGLHVRASVVSLVKGVLALAMLAAVAVASGVDFASLPVAAVLLFALSAPWASASATRCTWTRSTGWARRGHCWWRCSLRR